MLKLLNHSSLGLAALLLVTGCAQQQPEQQERQRETGSDFTRATAVIHPTAGNEVTGTVTFVRTGEGVRVQAELEGLEEGKHGFHIHEYGDCRAEDGTSAGGHYNPTDQQHGSPTQEERHMGDMGNLLVDEDGTASLDYEDPVIELNGTDSIIGRAVIVHSGEDDFTSQPTGDAGDRLGCGVIGIANTEM